MPRALLLSLCLTGCAHRAPNPPAAHSDRMLPSIEKLQMRHRPVLTPPYDEVIVTPDPKLGPRIVRIYRLT